MRSPSISRFSKRKVDIAHLPEPTVDEFFDRLTALHPFQGNIVIDAVFGEEARDALRIVGGPAGEEFSDDYSGIMSQAWLLSTLTSYRDLVTPNSIRIAKAMAQKRFSRIEGS